MPPVQRQEHVRYPYPSFNFQFIVTGIVDDGESVTAAFTEVSGLKVEKKVIEYRDGADEPYMLKGPGLTVTNNIELKQGVTGSVEFWQWMLQSMNGDADRRDSALIMLNEDRDEVMRWLFSRSWPMTFTGPNFKAQASEVAIHSLVLAHERCELDLA